MNDDRLDEIYAFAKELAVRAGNEILLKGFVSCEKGVTRKGQTDLVTKFDRESEAYIYSEIHRRFPSHMIIAEEGSRASVQHDLVWYVDPLDATTNFAHGIPHYSVSIAVYSQSKKRSVAGVVYEPNRKELFAAMTGCGSFLNNEKISVSTTNVLADALCATGFPYDKADARISNLPQVNEILPRVRCIRRMGSASLDLCYVACGRVDAYWEPMLHEWDVAAGALIVEEAGGMVTDYTGGRFDPVRPEIIASNGLIHDKMVSLIQSSTEHLPRTIVKRNGLWAV
jgi:myo-inositol-1(or 4)-monophosphatase